MLLEAWTQKGKLAVSVLLGSALFAVPVVWAQTEIAPARVAALSSDRGLAEPNKVNTVTVHLKLHNEAELDKIIEQIYTPDSPRYHKWLTKSELAAYAPTEEEVNQVRSELTAKGLSVLSVDANRTSVRARGTVANLENAFQTQIHSFQRDGKVFQANATAAKLTGPAGNLIDSVSGLTTFPMKRYARKPFDLKTGKSLPSVPAAKLASGGFGNYFTSDCFRRPAAVTLTYLSYTTPVGQYYGNIYDQGTKTCGWTPDQVLAHYGLYNASKGGLDGSGQTIVIIDGPSDATVADDLATFSTLAGLPSPNASNFQLIYPDGKPSDYELQYVSNWDDETTLDIEWAHGIAPKAKIVLLITPTEDWSEFEYAIQYAVDHNLGNIISNSYGYPEFLWGPSTQKGFDSVLKIAAASGVAVNFSSGDSGDVGTGDPHGGGASYPSTSTYVTQIGGTSIGLYDFTGGKLEVGWGTNETLLSYSQNYVLDPPYAGGFTFGSGGGESTLVDKPSWQSSLPGTGRQGPDISAIGDPFTGGIVVTNGFASSIGGTSLSSPVFSAIWALAQQKAGKSLGQAAPLLAKLPKTAFRDITPFTSATNPAGVIFNTTGSHFYPTDALLPPLYSTTDYFAALWNYGGGEYLAISFGTDTSLTTAPGWDNVTGWGVPNGYAFITSVQTAK